MRVLLGTADHGLSPPTLLLSPCLALSLFLVFQVKDTQSFRWVSVYFPTPFDYFLHKRHIF